MEGTKTRTMNRKERRYSTFHKNTKFTCIKYREDNKTPLMYLHPTKGFKGNKKAIAKFKETRE